ncbi:MAG TPA: VWA domain-containing protein, partial [Bryobacterales bacterium]|nr:VWA domain-containing protein [Bryobacterales bacterium]
MCRRTECWKFGNHDRRTGGGPRAGNTARAAALVISALLAAPVVGASQQAARSKPQETFRVTTRLVEVSVVAETKDGEPARGLKAEDFKLYDNGEPQKIVFFSRETPPRRRLPGPLPPNVYTNRFEQLGEDVAGVTVILFDGLNTPLVDQVYARQQILKFLRQLRPGDRVALYVMGRGPRVIKDVSGDAGALAAALEHYKPEQRPSLDAPLYDPSLTPVAHFNAWLGELTFHLTDYFDRDRAFRTVRALTAIARHLERLPGRKNLLWVSGSFPISVAGSSIPLPERLKRSASTGKWPETDRLMRALSRANLAIYPVDARGLIAPRNYRADSRTVTADDHLKDAQIFSVMRKLAART